MIVMHDFRSKKTFANPSVHVCFQCRERLAEISNLSVVHTCLSLRLLVIHGFRSSIVSEVSVSVFTTWPSVISAHPS